MVIDFEKVLEMDSRGLQVPGSLLSFARQCSELVVYAASLGCGHAEARIAFLTASEAGGDRDQLFAAARDQLVEICPGSVS